MTTSSSDVLFQQSGSLVLDSTTSDLPDKLVDVKSMEPNPREVYLHSNVGPPELDSLVLAKAIIIRRASDEKNSSEECRQNHFKYDLSNEDGTCLYMALEQSNRMSRLWFHKSRRPCKIFIVNTHREVVLNIQRPCTCCFCCWNGLCCNKVLVYSSFDSYLGKVKQNVCSCCRRGFTAWNGKGVKILKIIGPCACCCCCSPCCNAKASFKVYLADDTYVGDICNGMGNDAKSEPNFGASFHADLDVNVKALVLAAAFLIDLMYYKLGPSSTTQHSDIHEILSQPKPVECRGSGDGKDSGDSKLHIDKAETDE